MADSVVLEEEIDPDYEPTESEVIEVSGWFWMDMEELNAFNSMPTGWGWTWRMTRTYCGLPEKVC